MNHYCPALAGVFLGRDPLNGGNEVDAGQSHVRIAYNLDYGVPFPWMRETIHWPISVCKTMRLLHLDFVPMLSWVYVYTHGTRSPASRVSSGSFL